LLAVAVAVAVATTAVAVAVLVDIGQVSALQEETLAPKALSQQ
jgi:hypothetical protein